MSAATAAVSAREGWVELGKSTWADYLRALSAECAGSPIVLRMSHDASRQFAPHSVRLPLKEIRYDRRLDLFQLSLGGATAAGPCLRCFVSAPRLILAIEHPHSRSLLIVEHGGVKTLVRLARWPAIRV